ncbi:CHAT domain-containing protein, partial [Gammaproteobacteria bacterium]|nr:CHAT domain-containing protein [Gammaproteobacteria bacterium]
CLEEMGRMDDALDCWQMQAESLLLRPQAGGDWLVILVTCVRRLVYYSVDGKLIAWEAQFDALSRSLLEVIDLETPEQMDAAQSGVVQFYVTYLGLCVDTGRHDLIPKVLSVRQGRKLSALLLEELDSSDASLSPDSARGRFQRLRVELRQLALGLQVIEGDKGMADSDSHRFVDADTAINRQREQLDAYKAKLDAYRVLKAELQTNDPDFAISAAALNPKLPDLQARLAKDEGLLLLFERGTTEPTTGMALLITGTGSVLVPLMGVNQHQSAELLGVWRGQLHSRAGMRRAGNRDAVSEITIPVDDDTTGSELELALSQGLWTPLLDHLQGMTRLHVVTHGSWHLLPVELGAPDHLLLSHYPGFIYYHRLMHQQNNIEIESKGADQSVPLGLSTHAAEDDPSLESIPFVRAEAGLIESLWSGPVHSDPNLNSEQPRLGVLQLAAHGQADEKDPARANVILGNQLLDFHAVLEARQHPPVVILSACTVGRTTDDLDGEPLGLVGGFLLKGTRYVIASLQPVPDFYMPLLMTLFYQSWQITRSPDSALVEAKRRLRSGEWYPETEALIRIHYQPVIEQMLTSVSGKSEQTGWQDRLVQLTHAWPWPEPYRALHPDDEQDILMDLREAIGTKGECTKMAKLIIETLIDERAHLPTGAVDTLCTWVKGFGLCRI